MKINTRIAPLALAVALSFGMAACQGSYDAGTGTEEVEGGVEDTTDDSEDGGATADSDY